MEIPTVKKCSRCKITKPLEEFSKAKKEKYGVTPHCKKCHREYYKKTYVPTEESRAMHREYTKADKEKNPLKFRARDWKRLGIKITIEEFEELHKKQMGFCAICKVHEDEFEHKLGVDHCHKTGEIRGLLCKKCNIGLGYLKDNIENLKNAIEYLENIPHNLGKVKMGNKYI